MSITEHTMDIFLLEVSTSVFKENQREMSWHQVSWYHYACIVHTLCMHALCMERFSKKS